MVRETMDMELFGVLYDRFASKVYSKCLGITRNKDEAHDLTHDIFLKTFLNMGKFDGRSKFGTWLYRITFNYCMDHLRRNRKGLEDIDDRTANAQVDTDAYEHELMQLRADRLDEILLRIDAADRAVLLFKYQEELSVKEMSELLEMSESAVKMRLLRARERVMQQYRQLYPADE